MEHYQLMADVNTVHWGFFDGSLEPVLQVEPGDTVSVETLSCNQLLIEEHLEKRDLFERYIEITSQLEKGSGSHLLTGPIYVRGAAQGDVLEVKIKSIELTQDWGWSVLRPFLGTLPERFPFSKSTFIQIDSQKNLAHAPWGPGIPISPFFGQMAVAPEVNVGRVGSRAPGKFGGNIDCRALTSGSRLFLPVLNDGALFSVGDGHAFQGDGEVCGTAIETSLTGIFEFEVHKGVCYEAIRAETPTHYIALGVGADLEAAAVQATNAIIDWAVELLKISDGEAYSLCSYMMDLRITQMVNETKGVHAMLRKDLVKDVCPM